MSWRYLTDHTFGSPASSPGTCARKRLHSAHPARHRTFDLQTSKLRTKASTPDGNDVAVRIAGDYNGDPAVRTGGNRGDMW
jgi:hypothetical protein